MSSRNGREAYYEMPLDKAGLLQILDAVPSDWAQVDGDLRLSGGKDVQVGSRIILSCNRPLQKLVVGGTQRPLIGPGEKLTPNAVIALVRAERIETVSFGRAGLDQGKPMPYSDCLCLVKSLVDLDYKGRVHFYRMGEYADLRTALNHEGFGFDHEQNYLKTMTGRRGQEQNVQQILEAIKTIGLEPFGRRK